MTTEEKEQVNQLLFSNNEEDNKLAMIILTRYKVSVKNYISELYTEHKENRSKITNRIHRYCSVVITSSSSNTRVRISIKLTQKWLNYLKSIK